MKSYDKTVYGIRARSGPCELPTIQQVPARHTSMSVIIDKTNGDHKKPNANSWVKTKYFYPSGSQAFSSANYCWNYQWIGPQVLALNNSLTDSNLESEVYNRAVSRLYAKVRGDLDLSIAFFERGKTIAMLRSLKRLSTYVGFLKKGKIGDNWLMWQYGMRPLVSDIYATSRLLIPGQGLKNPHIRVRASGFSMKNDIYNYFGPSSTVPQKRRCESSYRTMFDIVFEPKPNVITSMAGFSSLNPISIAWELLPYSCVADWLWNIGGYLRNAESALLYQTAFKSGYYTNTRRIHRDSRVHGAYSDAIGTWSADCDYISIETAKNRVILSGMPFPRAPSFRVNLGAERFMSAVALLAQPLKGLGKIKG